MSTSHCRRALEQRGYHVLPGSFAPAEVRAYRAEASRLLAFLINASLANGRRSTRLDLKVLPSGEQVVRKIQPVRDVSPLFAALAADERVLAPIREAQGDEPALMEEKFSYKQRLARPVAELEAHPADDRFLCHQDYAYHAGHGYGPDIVTAGIVLDDCTAESGALQVWPGSHRSLLEHDTVHIGNYRSFEVAPERVPGEPVVLDVPAGTLLFFHDLIVHRSSANRTSRPRRILFFSYCPRATPVFHDIRNNPTRVAESPYEERYVALKRDGLFVDRFQPPEEEQPA